MEPVNFLFGSGIDHVHRTPAVGAWQSRRSSEQSANQRTLVIYLASLLAEIDAIVIGQSCLMLGIGFHRQPSYFFRRSRYRPAAIMTTDDALERRYPITQGFYSLIIRNHIASHRTPACLWARWHSVCCRKQDSRESRIDRYRQGSSAGALLSSPKSVR